MSGNDKIFAALEKCDEALALINQEIALSKSEEALVDDESDDEANGGRPEEVQDPTRQVVKAAEEPSKEEPPSDEKKDEEDKDKQDDDQPEESDDDLRRSYDAICKKMAARGLKKSETKETPAVEKKSSASEEEFRKAQSDVNDLKKALASRDAQIDELSKSIKAIGDLQKSFDQLKAEVERIGETPVPRQGVQGTEPLIKGQERKSEEKLQLSKSQVLDRLLKIQLKDPQAVTPAFVSKVESGRMSQADQVRLGKLMAAFN